MAKNDIGGFYVSLGLDPDRASFDAGNKLIDGMAVKITNLIGITRNAAVVSAMLGTAMASSGFENSTYKMAEAMGVSTEALDLWRASAKIAGVNADGLLGSMGKLANVLNHIKIDGSGLQEYEKKLGNLKMSINEFQREDGTFIDADQAYGMIIERAQAMVEEAKANLEGDALDSEILRITTIVGDVLGGEGQNFFIELERLGKTLKEFQGGAGKTIFNTPEGNKNSQNFVVEARILKSELESMGRLFGDKLAEELSPKLEELNNWIQNNGPAIRDVIDKLVELVGQIATFTSLSVGTGKTTVGAIKHLKEYFSADTPEEKAEALSKIKADKKAFENNPLTGWLIESMEDYEKNKIINENRNATAAGIKAYYDRMKKAGRVKKGEKLDYNTLEDAERYMIEDYLQNLGGNADYVNNFYKNVPKMKDGIMRPDGTVTQVAPDDWVFAARNVGDLAKAFIPQMPVAMAGGNQEYVINQTFNISGGNDLPQVIRQQAYAGTQEGLLQAMQESSRRMQLMTGMR